VCAVILMLRSRYFRGKGSGTALCDWEGPWSNLDYQKRKKISLSFWESKNGSHIPLHSLSVQNYRAPDRHGLHFWQ
jgi:hypothetical protein